MPCKWTECSCYPDGEDLLQCDADQLNDICATPLLLDVEGTLRAHEVSPEAGDHILEATPVSID